MKIKVCPECEGQNFSILEKLRFVADGEIVKCQKCGMRVGVFVVSQYLIMSVATAGFTFSFAYFFGEFGFINGNISAVLFALFLLVTLSIFCPVFRVNK